MSERLPSDPMCADCGGWDIEWMRSCHKHKGVQFCRGCSCPTATLIGHEGFLTSEDMW